MTKTKVYQRRTFRPASGRAVAPRVAALVAMLALLAVACGAGGSNGGLGPEPTSTGPVLARCTPSGVISVGEAIPSCSFERLEGGTFALASLKGKPSVLNWWASWCTFCIKEMPDFQAAYERLDGAVEIVGFDTLGVQGETAGAARSFAASTGVRYPLVFDPDGLLYAHFSLNLLMPTTVFVDAEGVVAFRQFGPLSEERLLSLIEEHLSV